MEVKADVMESFQKWQDFLGKGAGFLEKLGIAEKNLAGIAKGMGDFLADSVDPANPQQRVIKDLWDCADDNEKQTIATLVLRMSKHHASQPH